MKLIRNHLAQISFLMSLTLLFFSCSQYDDLRNAEIEHSPKYSGQDIFKGLFFFQNDIPENISALKGIKSQIRNSKNDKNDILSALEELSDISVNYINKKYPDFFDELQTAMYSGNLYEIENGLNKSVKMIEQATLASNEYSDAFVLGEKIQNDIELKNQILKLDLNKESDVKEFRDIISKISNTDEVAKEAAFFAAAAAVFYIVAAAVSFVVAAYSVVTKAAYWDPTEKIGALTEESTISKEITIAEIGDFFQKN